LTQDLRAHAKEGKHREREVRCQSCHAETLSAKEMAPSKNVQSAEDNGQDGLAALYYRSTGGFQSAADLLKSARASLGRHFTLKDIQNFLRKQAVHQDLHTQPRNRDGFLPTAPWTEYQMDLIFVRKNAKEKTWSLRTLKQKRQQTRRAKGLRAVPKHAKKRARSVKKRGPGSDTEVSTSDAESVMSDHSPAPTRMKVPFHIKFHYVFLAIDVFTKKLFACLVPDKTSDTLCEVIARAFDELGGPPVCVLSDDEAGFRSGATKFLLEKLGVWHVVLRGGYPRFADRATRTLKRMLYLRHQALHAFLPFSQILADAVDTYNARLHRSTGFSPNDLCNADETSDIHHRAFYNMLYRWRGYGRRINGRPRELPREFSSPKRFTEWALRNLRRGDQVRTVPLPDHPPRGPHFPNDPVSLAKHMLVRLRRKLKGNEHASESHAWSKDLYVVVKPPLRTSEGTFYTIAKVVKARQRSQAVIDEAELENIPRRHLLYVEAMFTPRMKWGDFVKLQQGGPIPAVLPGIKATPRSKNAPSFNKSLSKEDAVRLITGHTLKDLQTYLKTKTQWNLTLPQLQTILARDFAQSFGVSETHVWIAYPFRPPEDVALCAGWHIDTRPQGLVAMHTWTWLLRGKRVSELSKDLGKDVDSEDDAELAVRVCRSLSQGRLLETPGGGGVLCPKAPHPDMRLLLKSPLTIMDRVHEALDQCREKQRVPCIVSPQSLRGAFLDMDTAAFRKRLPEYFVAKGTRFQFRPELISDSSPP
jgi:hypothetical protein